MKSIRDLKDIGALVRFYRQKRDLSQAELGQKAGVSQVFISKLENGSGMATQTLVDIMRVLRVEIFFKEIESINTDSLLDMVE
jgi:transcriptional regulator with XRE-family HTH domain